MVKELLTGTLKLEQLLSDIEVIHEDVQGAFIILNILMLMGMDI